MAKHRDGPPHNETLGRYHMIGPINWRIRPCASYLPSPRPCSAQYHRSHLPIAIQSTRLRIFSYIGQLLSRSIFLCRSRMGSRFAFQITNLYLSRTKRCAPKLELLQLQEAQPSVRHRVSPIPAAPMTLRFSRALTAHRLPLLTAQAAATPELQAPTTLSRAMRARMVHLSRRVRALPPVGVNEFPTCAKESGMDIASRVTRGTAA